MTTTRQRRPPSLPALPPLRPVCIAIALLATLPAGQAAPTGAVLAGGQASVRVTAPGQMQIVQTTPRATLDWTNFSIAAGERVNVAQPDSRSVLLNRVLGDSPSLIYGSLTANGSVWLVNPRGIVFGAGSRVDVGSLVATTLAITNEDLASGRLQLGAGAGAAGALRSEGQITATDGSVVLVAPNLVHSGQITARRVGLAAATEVLVDVEGDGLVFFNARNDQLDARLQVLGGVRADGGTAEIRAAARAGFADTVLNLDGVVQARSLGRREGRIVIDGGTSGNTIVNGRLDATGAAEGERGGSITVLGQNVGLAGGAVLDASGRAGGGSVRVGGDYQGANPELHNAARVSVVNGAQIAADASGAGDGGRVIVWADEVTRFGGSVSARGGAAGGDGGFAEVSGKQTLSFAGTVDLTAPRGRAGTLLLDPDTISITDAAGATALPGRTVDFTDSGNADSFFTKTSLNNLLGSGNVSLAAKSTITVTSNGPAVSGSGKLTLKAGGDIVINTGISAAGGIELSAADPDPTATTVNTGHVQLATGVTLDAGSATLSITNNSGNTKHSLAGNLVAGTLTLVGGATIPSSPGSVQWTLSGDSTIAGTVDGSGTLVKAGPGKLGFAGASSKIATGTLSVTGGSVELTSGSADRIATGTTVNVASGGRLTVANIGEQLGTLALNGGIADGSASLGAADFTSDGASRLDIGVVSSNSARVRSGVLSLGNAGSTGSLSGTDIDVASGAELRANRTDSLTLPKLTGTGTLRVSGGTVTLGDKAETLQSILVDAGSLVAADGAAKLGSANVVTVAAGATLTLGDTNETIGSLALAGTVGGAASLQTGSLAASGSVARISTSVNATGGTTLASGTTLTIGNGGTAGALAGAITLNTGNLLVVDRSDAVSLGTIQGTEGHLRKLGAGTLTLTATTGNVSTIEVKNGTLALADGSGARIGDGAAVTVDAGATLQLGNTAESIGSLDLSGMLAGSVALQASSYTLRAGSVVNAALSGGALGTAGSGTVQLNGASTLGSIDVVAGTTLQLGASSSASGTAAISGTLSGSGTLTAATYDLNNATVSAPLGTGTVNSIGNGTSSLGAAVAATTITVSNGTLSLGAGGLLTGTPAVVVRNGTTLLLGGGTTTIGPMLLSGIVAGTGTLQAASLSASGTAAKIFADVSTTGGTTMDGGAALTVGDGGTAGSLAGTVTLEAGNSLIIDRFDDVALTSLAGTAGALEKLGAGKLTVGTTTGGVTTINVREGTLALADGLGARIADGAAVTVDAGATLQLGNTAERIGSLDLSGMLSGAAALQASSYTLRAGSIANASLSTGALSTAGSGTSQLNAASTLGSIAVAAGTTLQLGASSSASGTADIGGTLAGSGTLTAATYNLNNATVGTPLGTGTVNSIGSGTSSLGAAVAATAINVNNGTLSLGAGGLLTGTPAVDVGAGTTLALNGGTTTIGALQLAGTVSGAGTLQAASLSASGTAGRIFADISTTGGTTLGSNATLSVGDHGTAGSLAGTVTLVAGNRLVLDRSDDVSLASLAGSGGALEKRGAGKLTVGATTGGVTTVDVKEGTLALANGLGARVADGAAVTVDAGAALQLGDTTERIGSLDLGGTLSGAAALQASSYTLRAGSIANAALSTGALSTAGSGTSQLNAASTLGSIAVAAGTTLQLGTSSSASGTADINGTLTGSGTLTAATYNLNNATVGTPLGTGTVNSIGSGTSSLGAAVAATAINLTGGTLSLGAGGLLTGTPAVDVGSGTTLSLGGGTTTIGTLQLAGTVSGSGTLQTGALSASGSAARIFASVNAVGGSTLGANATLTVGNHGTAGSLSGSLTLNSGNRLVIDRSDDVNLASLAGSGGALEKRGAGKLTVGTTTGSVGTIDVKEGTLALADGSGARIGDATAVTVDTGATLQLGNTAETIASLDLSGTLSGTSALTAASYTLRAGSVAGAALSQGALATSGSGTAQLNAASVLDSVDVVAGSTLQLGADSSTASANLAGTLSGGHRLTVTSTATDSAVMRAGSRVAGGTTLAGAPGVSLAVDGGSATLDGRAEFGNVQVRGGSTLVLGAGAADRLSDLGDLALLAGGTLRLNSDETIRSLSGTGSVTGSGRLTTTTLNLDNSTVSAPVTAGALTSTGASAIQADVTITGSAHVTGGTLTIGGTVDAGVLGVGGTTTVDSGATLRFARSAPLTLAAPVTGAGTLEQAGSGTLTLAALVDTSRLRVQSGTLALASGSTNRIGDSTAVTVAGGASLQMGSPSETVGSLDLSGILVGPTQTLSAAAATLRSGALVDAILNAGTLDVPGLATLLHAGRLGVGTALNVDGGTLTLAGNETVASARLAGGQIMGIGSLTTTSLDSTGTSRIAVPASLGSLQVAGSLTLAADASATGLAGSGGISLSGAQLTVQVPSATTSSFAGNLFGGGSLVKDGAGTLNISGALTQTGATSVSGGTLALAASATLPAAGDVTVGSGATLTLAADASVHSLALSGTLAGGATLSAGSYALNGGSVAAGAGLGGGTLTSRGNSRIAGTAAAGSVTVADGTLTLAGSQRLTANPDVSVARNSTLLLQGAQAVDTLDLRGTLDGSGQALSARTLVTLGDGAHALADLVAPRADVTGDARLTGALGGGSNAAALNVNVGTLTLASAGRLAASTDVTVAAGAALGLGGGESVHSLTLSGALTGGTAQLVSPLYTLLGNASVAARLGDGTLNAGTDGVTGTVTLAADAAALDVHVLGGTLRLAGGQLAGQATVTVHSGARMTLSNGASIGSLFLSGILDGSGTLSATSVELGGTADVDLAAPTLTNRGNSQLNGHSNASSITLLTGTLTLGSAGRLLAAPSVVLGGAGVTLNLGGAETFGRLSGGGTVDLGGATLTTGSGIDSTYAGSIIGSGGLIKTGASTFTLASASTYTGTTLVQDGTLQLDGTLKSPTVQVTGGKLVMDFADRLTASVPIRVDIGAAGRLNLNSTQSIDQLDIAGTLAGSGTLTARQINANGATLQAKLGAGRLQSSGITTLSGQAALGTVQVDDGTLALGTEGRFTATPAVTVAGGALLRLGGAETFGTLAGGGVVDLGDFTLSTGSGGSSRFDGQLSGAHGSLLKQGSGSTFTLAGQNGYGGATTVSEGTLATTADDRLPTGNGLLVSTGARLELGGNQTALSLVLFGNLSGSGKLTARNYTLNSGTVGAPLGTGRLNSNGSSRLDAAVEAQDVHVDSGTLTAAAGVLASGATVTVNRNATLTMGGANHVAALDLSGTLAGNARLTADAATMDGGTITSPLGGSTLDSTGASRIEADVSTRTVRVGTGVLTLASGATLAPNADLAVSGGARLQLDTGLSIATFTLAGTLDGSATLNAGQYTLDGGTVNAPLGRGQLTSTGASRLAGTADVDTLTVGGGTLELASAGRLTHAPVGSVATGATLQLRGSETLGSLAGGGTVDLGANPLTTGNAGDSRFDGVLQGTGGSLLKVGGSVFTLGGANLYTGATTVQAGTLATSANDRLPDDTALRVADGATLRLGGNDRVKTLLLSGTLAGTSVKLSADSYTLDGGTATADLGSGVLVARNQDLQRPNHLDGSSDATTVTVASGELQLGAAERLADAADLTIVRGATLRLAGDEHVRTAVIRGTLAGSGVLTAATYTLDGATLNADIGGGGLIISSDTLLAARTNAGTITIQAGTLTLADAGRFNASPAVTLSSSGRLALGGDETVGQLAGDGRVELGSFTLRTGSGGDSRFDGVIAGTGSLVKQGGFTFTLGGTQAYTGATVVEAGTLALAGTLESPVVNLTGGTLALGAAERLPDAAAVGVDPGATLSLSGNETIGSLRLAGLLNGSGRLDAGTYSLVSGTVSADLGTGTLRSAGSSRIDGSAAVGSVDIVGGTLVLGSANRLTAAPALTVAGGATLQLLGNQTLGTLAGSGSVDLGSFLLATGSGGNSRFDGVAGGSGGLVKQGDSVFTLGGANTYGGPTRVEAGTLALAADDRLGNGTAVDVAGPGTLDIGSFADTVGSLNLVGRLAGTGTLSAPSYMLAGGTAVANLGAGALASNASSRLEGTAAVSAVDVTGGTLLLAAADRLTQRPAVNVAANATLRLAGDQTLGTLAGAGTVDTGAMQLATGIGGDSRFDGSLSGGGTLVKQGSSRFVLGGTAATDRLQVDAGTLALAAADRVADTAAVLVGPAGTLALSGNDTVRSLELAGQLNGTGTLSAETYALAGGTADADLGAGALASRGASRLNGSSAAGTVAVAEGTLTLGAANRLADGAAVTVARGATLALDATDTVASLAVSGTLAGAGTLTSASVLLDGGTANANLGAGALVSRNASTLAGTAASTTVTVESGQLTLASANRFSAAPAVDVKGGASLVLGGDQVFGTLAGGGELGLGSFSLATGSGGSSSFEGVIGGSGGLVKQGSSSIFTLNGASTYTGATRVAAGTLRLGSGGTLASSRFDIEGTLVFAHADELRVAQPIAGTGQVEQAGSGRLVFSGANKSFTGQTLVSSGELATSAAGDLAPGSALRVAAGAKLTLAGRETVRSLDADGSLTLRGDLTATQDLVMHGAVDAPGDVKLSGQRIVADSAGNRFAGTLSLDAGGAVTLNAGLDGSTAGGATARPLTLGTVSAAAGGRIEAGTITLTNATNLAGGTLELVSAADSVPVQPAAELIGRQATGLQIAFASDAVAQQGDASRITLAQGAGLAITASRGASVQLLAAGNSFLGNLSVVSGRANTAWQANPTSAPFGGTVAMQARVRVEGTTVNVGGDGLVADVLDIRADRLATVGDTATLVARLPYDTTAGTAVSLPAMTLRLTPEAFNLAFPFGNAGAANGLRVDIGSRNYGSRTLPLDAGYVTVLPRGGARGATAVLLTGPVVNPSGGYRFFFDGAGVQGEIPVFYNGVLPNTPAVENSISATVAVSEGARKDRFEEAVRTENVAVRLRAGVIAEVGPAPSATQGTEGIRVPLTCPPAAGLLSCGASR